MVKGVTESGYKFAVDPEVLKDMEFIELAAAAQENGLMLPKMIAFVLGEEGKQALYDHVRNDKGRVLLEDINTEFAAVLGEISKDSKAKN